MTSFLLDCDGVLWAGSRALPGAVEGLACLEREGAAAAFFTNNSYSPLATIEARLARLGVDLSRAVVLSSPQALASMLEQGERALVLGGAGVLEAVERRGVAVARTDAPGGPGRVDAVVVALDRALDYDRLAAAVTAVLAGARLLAMNADPVFPGEGGRLLPGTGPIAAAVACATGVRPRYCGKPYPPAVELVRERVGSVDAVIGDQPSSDGALAEALGARFGLVRSGLARQGDEVRWPVHAEGDDLLAVVRALLDLR